MWEFLTGAVKKVATGNAQAAMGLQSPHLPGAIVRIGRFLYSFSAIWITVSWYVGYANQHSETGQGPHLVLPGKPKINTPDRPTKTPAFVTAGASAGASLNWNGSGSQGNGDAANVGGIRGAQARMAVATSATNQVGKSGYVYSETRPYPNSLNSRPCKTDCSGFSILNYKAAGAPDPNGTNYNGQGYTGSLWERGALVTTPNIGDLAFWSNPDHVAIVVASGRDPIIVGFGAPPGPIKNTVSNESLFHAAFMGFRSYL